MNKGNETHALFSVVLRTILHLINFLYQNGFCEQFLFCCAVASVVYCFAFILLGKGELVVVFLFHLDVI